MTTAGIGTSSALTAARTAALFGRADSDGRMTQPYGEMLLQNARVASATAQSDIAEQEVPTSSSAVLRDQLVPMLVDVSAAVGDMRIAADAGDEGGVRSTIDRLDRLAEQLSTFVESNQ